MCEHGRFDHVKLSMLPEVWDASYLTWYYLMLIVIAAIPLDSPWVPAQQQWIPGSSPRFGTRFSKHLLNSFMGWPRSSSGLDCIKRHEGRPGIARMNKSHDWSKSQTPIFFSHITSNLHIQSDFNQSLGWMLLVVSNMNCIFHNISIYGMWSFPLTNSIIFQRGRLKPPTRDWLICLWILINDGWWLY